MVDINKGKSGKKEIVMHEYDRKWMLEYVNALHEIKLKMKSLEKLPYNELCKVCDMLDLIIEQYELKNVGIDIPDYRLLEEVEKKWGIN